jgi:hypothetical protein
MVVPSNFGWFIDPKIAFTPSRRAVLSRNRSSFSAMLMSTRIKQTPLQPQAAILPSVPLVPPEITATGAAPIAEAEENV